MEATSSCPLFLFAGGACVLAAASPLGIGCSLPSSWAEDDTKFLQLFLLRLHVLGSDVPSAAAAALAPAAAVLGVATCCAADRRVTGLSGSTPIAKTAAASAVSAATADLSGVVLLCFFAVAM